MQLDRDRLRLGDQEFRYYLPLDAFRPGRYAVRWPRRMATLAWQCLAERCVELPVARAFLAEGRWSTLLEVGNVLGYWYDLPPHVVVDRYERGPGIVNQDISEYRSDDRFDVVVSISTLEHVGFDESHPDPERFVAALRSVEALRRPDGRLLLSVPLGYNPAVDRAVATGEFARYRTAAVVGDQSGRRGWKEVPVGEALSRGTGILFARIG